MPKKDHITTNEDGKDEDNEYEVAEEDIPKKESHNNQPTADTVDDYEYQEEYEDKDKVDEDN